MPNHLRLVEETEVPRRGITASYVRIAVQKGFDIMRFHENSVVQVTYPDLVDYAIDNGTGVRLFSADQVRDAVGIASLGTTTASEAFERAADTLNDQIASFEETHER